MNAFDKAKDHVESAIAENGEKPQEVTVTLYRDAAQFQIHHPYESYRNHLTCRARLVDWLKVQGIPVIDAPVAAEAPTRPRELAELGYRSAARFRPGDPYRLGLSLASDPRTSTSALGWFILPLGHSDGGEG